MSFACVAVVAVPHSTRVPKGCPIAPQSEKFTSEVDCCIGIVENHVDGASFYILVSAALLCYDCCRPLANKPSHSSRELPSSGAKSSQTGQDEGAED